MYNLPQSTIVNRVIPKKTFVNQWGANTRMKDHFTNDVVRVEWLAKLAPSTINVADGKEVHEITIFLVPIKDENCPVPVSLVKNVTGFYGERMKLNRDVYLKNFPIDKYVDFIVERQHTTWDWTKAEQHGKWLESAYLSAIQSGDSELMSKARTVLKRIVESQEENGYLGATARSYRSDKRPVRGMDAYELYFVFHAFITVYEQTGDKDALAAVEKLADYYLKYFGPGIN